MKEKIENEKKMWEKYYNNYDNLARQVLADVLAYFPVDKRQDEINNTLKILEQLKNPLEGEMLKESIKLDLDSFTNINNESAVAYRTLQWIEEIMKEDK